MRYSVLGTGLIGTAVAHALAKSGRDTAVWNRTISRAKPLAKVGVSVHADIGSVLDAADAVVLTVLDLDSALETLDGHFAALEDKAVINLMSGTPALAREMAQRLEKVGARYLDGTIQCYPSDIGAAEALINLSGDRAVWDAHKDALVAVAGRSTYVGEDPGAASILDAALAGTFYTAGLGAFCEALAFLRDSNIDPTRPEVALDYWLDLFRAQAMQLVDCVAKENFATSEATLAVYLAAVRQWRDTMLAAGQRGNIMAAAQQNLETADAAGYGSSSFAAQVLTISSPVNRFDQICEFP